MSFFFLKHYTIRQNLLRPLSPVLASFLPNASAQPKSLHAFFYAFIRHTKYEYLLVWFVYTNGLILHVKSRFFTQEYVAFPVLVGTHLTQLRLNCYIISHSTYIRYFI